MERLGDVVVVGVLEGSLYIAGARFKCHILYNDEIDKSIVRS